jgi:hypothetical protein
MKNSLIVSAEYIKTAPCFTTGKLVSSNSHGDEIRKTRSKAYLVIACSWCRFGTVSAGECVLEIISTDGQLDIDGLDFHTFFSVPFPRKGELIDIIFSDEAPNF